MSESTEVPDAGDLLSVDRELSDEEREQLAALGDFEWSQILQIVAQRAKDAYSPARSTTFTECFGEHMSELDHDEMIAAEVYNCPECGTLLKDRKSRVASGILLERARLAGLWLDVEQAKFEEFDAKFDRFRRALGLHR